MYGSITEQLLGSSADLRFIRQRVSWDEYERILAENLWNSSPRFTYDRGTLEVARFTFRQESTKSALAQVVNIVTEALQTDIDEVGSTTLKRRDFQRGVDPDSSFYIHHALEIREKEEIELPVDPAPVLVIDIAAAGPSLNKLPLYADFGTPEVWRYDEASDRVAIFRLRGSGYQPMRESAALVPITSDLLTRLVHRRRIETFPVWVRELRAWIRSYD